MKDETLAVDGDTAQLVTLYGHFAQVCQEMMVALERFIAAYRSGAEFPPRNEWPDMLLEPDINAVRGQLLEEGRLLKRFRPGKLPDEVLKAGNHYIKKEDELVWKVEKLTMLPCLHETRSADHALWNYMKAKSDEPCEVHYAKVDSMIAEKLRCYHQNAISLYSFLARAQSGEMPSEAKALETKTERAMINKLERMTEDMNVLARGDEAHFWQNWRGKKKVRAMQVKAVWRFVQESDRQIAEAELNTVCKKVYKRERMGEMVKLGGYPTAAALYQICHKHSIEILRGV